MDDRQDITIDVFRFYSSSQRPTIRLLRIPDASLGTLFSLDSAAMPPALTELSNGDPTSLPLVFTAKRSDVDTDDAVASLQYVRLGSAAGDTSCAQAVEIRIRHVRVPPEAPAVARTIPSLLAAYPHVEVQLPDGGNAGLSIWALPASGVLRSSSDASAPALEPHTRLSSSRVYFFPDVLQPSGEVLATFTYAVHDDVGASAPATVTLRLASEASAAVLPVGGAGYAARFNGTSHLSLGKWSEYASIHAQVCTTPLACYLETHMLAMLATPSAPALWAHGKACTL